MLPPVPLSAVPPVASLSLVASVVRPPVSVTVEPIVALPASLSPAVEVTPGPLGSPLVGALVLPWTPVEGPEVEDSVMKPAVVAGVLEHATRSAPQSRSKGGIF